MNKSSNSSINTAALYEDDDVFDNSSFFANLEAASHKFETNRLSTNNLNETLNAQDSLLNISALCCDEEISGYDKIAGQTWIYPTNYPVRQYQFNIIQATIVKNTLVSLPTGLGKTFIAAVIMYNFYRWYPLGKIIFTAPTRPLVAQQIDACYNIVAIPPSDSIEMTGNTPINKRKIQWENKRVVFATPQVIYNDIQSGICPAEKIRCIVFDEAHRARGNYAYCQIISTLTDMNHKTYRVLALSATPGSKVEDVINVVKSLHIAHLELRSEHCIDVAPYSHSRKINTTVIPLGPELTQLRNQYVEIIDEYARRLKQLNVLPQNIGNLSKGRIVMLYKECQNRDRGARHPQHNQIMKDFTFIISLYHGLELLIRHGSRVFLNFFDDHPEKSWIQSDDRLMALLERLRDDLGVNPSSLNLSVLPDGSVPEIPTNLSFGHPKFDILRQIMLDHFNKFKDKGQETKSIVFCEYRESVSLVHCLLLQCRPLIVPQMFVGQGAGKVSQKQQLRVMRSFREGTCNTLVATCVAEEGLDVGNVDLIICFDISTRSPVRLVQRCGRTGRERGGQVYILVTEGKEHQTLMDCMRQRDGLNQKISNSKEVKNNLYKLNPRMIPHGFTPQCQKMHITVAQKNNSKDKDVKKKNITEKNKKGQTDLREMFVRSSSGSSKSKKDGGSNTSSQLSIDEYQNLFPEGFVNKHLFPNIREYWAQKKDDLNSSPNQEKDTLSLTTWLEWQRNLQPTVNIGHSSDSEVLSELLQYIDAKRLELPACSQNPTFNTQMLSTQNLNIVLPIKSKVPKKKQKLTPKSPSKKDGDIRTLFSTATKSTRDFTKLVNELGIKNDGNIPTTIIDLLVDLSVSNSKSDETPCHICRLVCNCMYVNKIEEETDKSINFGFLEKPNHPDLNLLDEITPESLKNYLNNRNLNVSQDCNAYNLRLIESKQSNNFYLDFEFLETNSPIFESPKPKTSSHKNFDLGDIEDIFADSLPGEDMLNDNVKIDSNVLNTSDPKETLGFFGLDSIEDIFISSGESIDVNVKIINDNVCEKPTQLEIKSVNMSVQPPLSPSILSGTCKQHPVMTSPILPYSQPFKKQLSLKKIQPEVTTSSPNRKPRRLLEQYSSVGGNNVTLYKNTSDKEEVDSPETSTKTDCNYTKSLLSITQLVDMINKTNNEDPAIEHSQSLLQNYNQNFYNDRSSSPILLSQAEKKQLQTSNQGKTNKEARKSLIVLDSDSDFEDTVVYNINNEIETNNEHISILKSPSSSKRKQRSDGDDELDTGSPYFTKRRKVNLKDDDSIHSLQEKVRVTLNRNNNNVNYMFPQQKENLPPQCELKNSLPLFQSDKKLCPEIKPSQSSIRKLQVFRRKTKTFPICSNTSSVCNQLQEKSERPDNTSSDGSDDDFISSSKNNINLSVPKSHNWESQRHVVNHKMRKKKANMFLELEAELSGQSHDSGDELTDDSIGSIVDFICDDNETLSQQQVDMQAHYLKSVKSPVKGVFKIPQLPPRLEEVCSQVVNDDDYYEIDSFCVDSHIGLTQANDLSDLEIAEKRLEARRKRRKYKRKNVKDFKSNDIDPQSGDSPIVIKQKTKKTKRQISSDSDDSA